MAIIVVSDKPMKGVQRFLAESMRRVEADRAVGAALVVLKENGDVETGYWNTGVTDMYIAAGAIQADITDKIIQENFDRYMGMWNKEGEEDDEDAEP